MSTLNVNDSNISAVAFKELEELCTSDELSIDALQKKLNQYKSLIINNADQPIHNCVLFHQACMNKNVSLDIIQELLVYFPNAVETLGAYCSPGVENDDLSEAYPLHFCTYNPNCPSEVIQLLIEKYPAALQETCIVNYGVRFSGDDEEEELCAGLPLHYYLSRKKVDINTVQMMVNAFPQALQDTNNDMRYSPLHVAIANPNVRAHEHIPYLFTNTPVNIVQGVANRGVTMLHIACSNKGAGLEMVEQLCNMWPESIIIRDDFGDIPLHVLCWNEKLDETASLEILRCMLSMHPDSPRYVSDDHCGK